MNKGDGWLGAALSFSPVFMLFGVMADKGNWVALATSGIGSIWLAWSLTSLLKRTRRQEAELDELRRQLGQPLPIQR
jgi:hypothetical protein